MNTDIPGDEIDRLIERLLDGAPGEGDQIDFINKIVRELNDGELNVDEIDLRIERVLRACRIDEQQQSGAIVSLVDDLGDGIAKLECDGRNLSDSERLAFDKVVKAREILQEQLFPSERPVSAYHCPRDFVTDPEALQDVLDQTSERFDQTTPGRWQSRDSGFCCHFDAERFFDNLRITSKAMRWDEQLPTALEYLLTVRDCVDLRGIDKLNFIDEAFKGDHQVQELLAIARRQNEQKELALREQRFDDAAQELEEYQRTFERLNRLCVERDEMDSC